MCSIEEFHSKEGWTKQISTCFAIRLTGLNSTSISEAESDSCEGIRLRRSDGSGKCTVDRGLHPSSALCATLLGKNFLPLPWPSGLKSQHGPRQWPSWPSSHRRRTPWQPWQLARNFKAQRLFGEPCYVARSFNWLTCYHFGSLLPTIELQTVFFYGFLVSFLPTSNRQRSSVLGMAASRGTAPASAQRRRLTAVGQARRSTPVVNSNWKTRSLGGSTGPAVKWLSFGIETNGIWINSYKC